MRPLIAVFGATASGKTALAMALAEEFGGEILSCDSVAVYRGMEVGTAKPSREQRLAVRHHLLDLYDPPEACTAGDYARRARVVLGEMEAVPGVLPILAGGTGLYARALLDGLFAAPAADPALRELLRERASRRGAEPLHRTLARFDAKAAAAIHANDVSKVVRAIEVSLAARRPMTEQWETGRDGLSGYRVLRLILAPERAALYERIEVRAARMFERGLVEEMRGLVERWGWECRPFGSLGYAEAKAVLLGESSEAEALTRVKQGHRNFAKRQTTWFRREGELHAAHLLRGFGDAGDVIAEAKGQVAEHLSAKE